MRHLTLAGLALAALASAALPASAGLISSQTAGDTASVYANGGGTGFGGPLGNGSISMQITNGGANLDVTLTPGATLNDNVAIFLSTGPGGYTDAQLNDQGDGGRRAVTSPAQNGNINFPVDALPTYGLTIGNFGSVLFQEAPGSLPFVQFNGAQTISIPLASIGNPSVINWFALYTSDGTYMSNETMPADVGINAYAGPSQPNIGFDVVDLTMSNYNQFVVPEASAMSLLALPALMLGRRARRN